MKRALKFFMAMVICFLVGFVVTVVPVYFSIDNQTPRLSNMHLTSTKNVSKSYTINQTRTINKSISSAVRVVSIVQGEDTGQTAVSFASGTYFVYLGKHYVLTVSHAVVGKCSDLMVAYFNTTSNCVEIVHNNDSIDYAIIQVEEMDNRTPIKIPSSFVKTQRKMPKLLDKIFYTGYPNNMGPLTLAGRIAGFSDNGFIYIDSYAWTGSSGAGVFDQGGNLIGIIMALDVGVTQYGADVLENLLIVVPTYHIDWNGALH
jgi:S1-C subfamily serine protease